MNVAPFTDTQKDRRVYVTVTDQKWNINLHGFQNSACFER